MENARHPCFDADEHECVEDLSAGGRGVHYAAHIFSQKQKSHKPEEIHKQNQNSIQLELQINLQDYISACYVASLFFSCLRIMTFLLKMHSSVVNRGKNSNLNIKTMCIQEVFWNFTISNQPSQERKLKVLKA